MPDLRQLRAFVAVAEQLSFTRAAERLQIGTGSLGRIRVGITPAIAARDREDVIAAVRTAESSASVAFHEVRPPEVARKLRERELDLRLLLPSPPGTPFTDMVLAQFAAAGVDVTPVESHVTGSSSILSELENTQTVGLRPAGTELPGGVLAVAILAFRLPLFLLWPAGLPSPAVHRLRTAMADVALTGTLAP